MTDATQLGRSTAPLRWSALKHMVRSPAHYAYALAHPLEPTAAMRVGALAHKRILHGPGAFAVYREGRRAGKAWEAFQADHFGVEILNEPEAERVDGIVASIMSHPRAVELLTVGLVEERITWTVADRQCAGTPDCTGAAMSDLKVTADASPDRFPWHARRMLWPAQCAWYRHGEGHGLPYYIVAVESKPPYPVVIYGLTDDALAQGEKTWRAAFERLLVCEAANVWPGYSDAVVPLDSPDEDFSITMDGEEVSL